MAGRCFILINSRVCDAVIAIVLCVFFAYKKILGRTETRTRDRMCFQSIDISRDNRARIATCSLLTSTDRLKENYSIDEAATCHCSPVTVDQSPATYSDHIGPSGVRLSQKRGNATSQNGDNERSHLHGMKNVV